MQTPTAPLTSMTSPCRPHARREIFFSLCNSADAGPLGKNAGFGSRWQA